MAPSVFSTEFLEREIISIMSSILLISGSIGNILNCIIFTHRSLRQNACSFYFFGTSIANLLTLIFGCLTRLLISLGYTPCSSSLSIYCKIRSFFTMLGLTCSSWFIVAACADRYASSSSHVHIRSFSQVKIAQRVTIMISLMASLLWSQMFLCFQGNTTGVNCNPSTSFCHTFNDLILLLFYSILPPVCMFLFGILTIRNLHQRKIHRMINKKERQLTMMLIAQVVCVTILSLPISIQKIYAEFVLHQAKTKERQEVEQFFATLVVLIAFINTSVSFYLFTLTSEVFRKELKSILFCSRQRRGTIQPILLKAKVREKNPLLNHSIVESQVDL